MSRPRRNQPLVTALYVNAALLLAILVAVISSSNGRAFSFLPEAFAQGATQPIAGGGGVYLMPGQLSSNTWGCYVMDVEAQNLMAYQYFPGDKKLRLLAARSFRHDRKLHDFNTDSPTPADVAKLLEMEASGRRDNPDVVDAPEPKPGAEDQK